MTTAIVGAARAIFAESDEKNFTSSDIKNANSILNKLLNTLKSINYNDLNNYNHFHDTSTQKSNQLQSHIYNIMIEKRYDTLISQLYEKIPINDRNNNKIFFFQQIACLTANKNETSGAFLNSTSQSFHNKW